MPDEVPPELWLIAGPNGAGKTTVTRQLLDKPGPWTAGLHGVRILNPDDRALTILGLAGHPSFASAPPEMLRAAFQTAADETEEELRTLLRLGVPAGVETVLSSGKYRPVVEEVLKRGGNVYVIYIALSSPETAVHRVAHRAAHGGHDVPPDKVRSRWERSLRELPWFLNRASAAWIFDNSGEVPSLVTRVADGRLQMIHPTTFAELAVALHELKKAG